MQSIRPEVIEEYISYFDEKRSRLEGLECDESTTKLHFIQPFLKDVLKWPMQTVKEYTVQSEYKVQMGSQTKKVDFALVDEKQTPICFVEAKRVHQKLFQQKEKTN